MKHCIAVLVAGATLAASAQTNPPPVPLKDYGLGFGKLRAMGLPDCSKAAYVKLNAYGRSFSMHSSLDYRLKLSGNAWLIEEVKDGPSVLVGQQCRTVRVYDQKLLSKMQVDEQRKEMEEAKGKTNRVARTMRRPFNDDRIGGTWKKAELAKDLGKVIEFLEKAEGKEARMRRYELQNECGPLFLFAAHAYEQGFTNEANRVVQDLISHMQDPRRVVLSGVNALADAQYADAMMRFNASPDWPAFHNDLQGLLKRFSQGWKMAPAVKRLDACVAARLTNEPPAVAGEGLSAEDQRLARELAVKKPTQSAFFGRGLWILSKPRRAVPDEGEASAVDAIKRRGAASVPLLSALLGDTCLTPCTRQDLGGGYSYSSSSSDDELSEEIIQQLFNNMDRPLTRGDIARSLLMGVLITGNENSYEDNKLSDEDLRQSASEWVKNHGKKTRVELARLYFEEGNREQRQNVISVLMASTNAADQAVIEKYLGDPDKFNENSGLLQQYVMQKGLAAKPLVDKLAAALGAKKTKPAGKAGGEDEERGQEEWSQRALKSLQDMVGGKGLDEMLAEIAAGKSSAAVDRTPLMQRLSSEPPEKAIEKVLRAAVASTNPAVRVELMSYARYATQWGGRGRMQWGGFDEEQEEPVEETPPEPKPVDIKPVASLWAELMKDDREMPASSAASVSMTVSEVAIYALDGIYAPKDAEKVGIAYQVLGRLLNPIVRQRAEACLAGNPAAMPPLPAQEDVTAEHGAKLAAELAKADAAALPEHLKALSLSERLWLLANSEETPELNAKLATVANRVASVKTPAGEDAARMAQPWVGKPVSRDMVEAARTYCMDALKKGVQTAVTMVRQAGLQGVELTVRQLPAGRKEWPPDLMYLARVDSPSVVAAAYAGENGRAVWPIEGGKKEAAKPAAKAGSVEDELLSDALSDVAESLESRSGQSVEAFWKAVEALAAGKPAAAQTAQVMVMGVLAAPKDESVGVPYMGGWME